MSKKVELTDEEKKAIRLQMFLESMTGYEWHTSEAEMLLDAIKKPTQEAEK